jgi:membrane-bound lytic murein transglycosylase B
MSRLKNYALVAVITLCFFCAAQAGFAADSFENWLANFKSEAISQGLDSGLLDQALADIQPIDRVIELDRKQAEFTLTFDSYMAHVVSPARIKDGKLKYKQNRALLKKIGQQYGVPAAQIVAMWGIESDYGRATGNFPVLAALATLAYDGRRSQYFRGELFKALTMVAHGVPAEHMRGSWAGAMGQCQFMPSTYLNFASAASGTAPADIWSNPPDVWASTANYLKSLDWQAQDPWGMKVKLPKHGMASALFGLDHPRALKDWQRLGLKRANGGKLIGRADLKLSLIHADASKDGTGGAGPAYLVGDNFRALMHWNRSFFFALAAGTLADQIASR